MNDWIARLLSAGLDEKQIHRREPMHRHTTMRVGGPADALVEPAGEAQLAALLAIAREENVPVLIIGGGSNLIVRDGGVRGLVIKLSDRFGEVTVDGTRIHAQAGAKLTKVAQAAERAGLTGLEFAAGIPGTVGGGVLMNAGAYGGEIAQVLTRGRVLIDRAVTEYAAADYAFGYRYSRLMDNGGIALGATFSLKRGDPGEISERMADLAQRRRDKQPLNFPSAGSTFKRPEGHFAGALIERAGLKGAAVGGARVSEKHAGFVVNAGGATARDVLNLIDMIQKAVHAHAGVHLNAEVRVVGEE